MTGKRGLPKETKAVVRVLRKELREWGMQLKRIADAVVEIEYDLAERTGADNVRVSELQEVKP